MGEFYGNQYTDAEYDDYTYEKLVDDVAELAEELGEVPTTRDAEADDRLPCLSRMYDLIEEEWATVLADAGLESNELQVGEYDSKNHDKMLADLRRVNEKTAGKTLTMREYDDHGGSPRAP